MLKKLKELMHLEKLKIWEWILLIGVMLLLSSLYLYTDIVHTSSRGYALWSSLFEGKLNTFYRYPYSYISDSGISYGSGGGAYDFCIYFIFAIYNFPMWVWEKITGFSVFMFYPTRLYIKGIIWLFTAFSSYMLHKIVLCCEFDKNRAKWCAFIFLSSGLFFYPEVVIGGYDIISVAFTLLGIYGFLNKNNKCFIISFGIAMACKLFAFWIFVPLLLLNEKKIRYLLLNSAGALSFIAIPKLYFGIFGQGTGGNTGPILPTGSGGTDIISHSNIVNDYLFYLDKIPHAFIKFESLPLVFVGMFIIWILCYFCKRELSKIQVIYLCAVVMSVFVLTSKVHPYWVILLTPYIALLMSFNLDSYDKNAILEILMSIGFVCRMVIYYYWCSGLNLINYMLQPNELIQYIWDEDEPMSAYGMNKALVKLSSMTGISKDNIASLFGALFVAALVVFLYMNFPREKSDSPETDFAKVRLYTYLRVALAVFIGLFPVWGYIMWKIDG